MTAQTILLIAAIGGLVSVVLGAFGAHKLRQSLAENQMTAFETAVTYQMTHSLALMGVGILMLVSTPVDLLRFAALSFVAGVVLFSGSLYGLVFSGRKWLGPVTPLGGLFLIGGWVLLILGIWNLD